jgi:predicted thioesterase
MELPNLKIGLTGSAEITVQDADTAPRIGSGRVSVLATPVMINLNACCRTAIRASARGLRSGITPQRRWACACAPRPS